MVKPSRRKEMAQRAIKEHMASIRTVCLIFYISETCYRYQAKLSSENEVIADWLLRLTSAKLHIRINSDAAKTIVYKA